MPETWYVEHAVLEEDVVPGKRLGRRVRHDSRSLAYRWQQSEAAPASQLWARHIEILDQNGYGSCTGEAETGALGTDPLFASLTAAQQALLTQAEALKLYSAAEIIDGGAGLPSEDNGSSGLSVAQAAKNAGLISGYLHCLSLDDVLGALQTGPVIIGSNWYQGMDSPDSSGLVIISGSVRGGHEYLCRGVDVSKQLLFLDNSWGTSYGVNGSFSYSYDTLARLLAEQGDATVSVPLTQPPPHPVPVPDTNTDDVALASAVRVWAYKHHLGSSVPVATAIKTWLRAKGL